MFWLRSLGVDEKHSLVVESIGYIYNDGHWITEKIGVRPAMWVKI